MTDQQKNTLLYIHVPKTAGITMDQVLNRHYPEESIYTVRDDIQASYQAFKDLALEERAAYRVVKGHIPYGIHRYISGSYAYLTFLREPIERTISHYYFLKRKRTHPLSDLLGDDGLTLEQLLEQRLDKMMFNAHVRLISGVWYEPMPGACTAEHLELAKEHLSHFAAFGLTERFDESLILFQEAFNWSDLRYRRSNVTIGRPARADLPTKTLTLLENANLLDLELYDYALGLFEEKIRGRERQISARVQRLKLANNLAEISRALRQPSLRTFIRERWGKRF